MLVKSTPHNFTSVNFIPNHENHMFQTTDKNGQVRIFSKISHKNLAAEESNSRTSERRRNFHHSHHTHKKSEKIVENCSDNVSLTENSSQSCLGNSEEPINRKNFKRKISKNLVDSCLIANSNLVAVSQHHLHMYQIHVENSACSLNHLSNVEVEIEGQKISKLSCVSQQNENGSSVYVSDEKGSLYNLDLQSGQLTHFHDNKSPITKILNLDTSSNNTVFATTDLSGRLTLFDSRSKTEVLRHKCGPAPGLLCLGQTGYGYSSQNLLACGAENGVVYLYDLKYSKASKGVIFDKNLPLPIFDLKFNQNKPETLYTGGLFNVSEITSIKKSSSGQPCWFEIEDDILNVSNSSSADTQISTTRNILHKSELANFTSLATSHNDALVAVSDNGIICCM